MFVASDSASRSRPEATDVFHHGPWPKWIEFQKGRLSGRPFSWPVAMPPIGSVMPTKVGTQTTILNQSVDAWLDPGLRRDDGRLR
ncbi:protein of unknown function [Hyphomicrobium sp. MC1]|nr:protein of unknown function [Hyphomicrobium sp. MC1]